jgi:hypothetical protein
MESVRASFEKLKAVSLVINEEFTEASSLILQLNNEEYAEVLRETSIPSEILQKIEGRRSSAAKSQSIAFVEQHKLEEAALLVVRLNDEDYFQVLYCAALHGDASWFSSLMGWQSFKPAYLLRLDDKGVDILSHVLTSKCKGLILALLNSLADMYVRGEEVTYPAYSCALLDLLSNAAHEVIEDLLIELLSKDKGHVPALLLMRCLNSGVSLKVFDHSTAIKFAIAHDYKRLFVAYFLAGFPLYHFKCYMEIGASVANFYLPLLDVFETLTGVDDSEPAQRLRVSLDGSRQHGLRGVNLLGERNSRMFLKLPLRKSLADSDIFLQFFPALERLIQSRQESWQRAHDIALVNAVVKQVLNKQERFENYSGFAEFVVTLNKLQSQFQSEFHSGEKSVFDYSPGESSDDLGTVFALKQFIFSLTEKKYKSAKSLSDEGKVSDEVELGGRLAFSVPNNHQRVNASGSESDVAAANAAATVSDFILARQSYLNKNFVTPDSSSSLTGSTVYFFKKLLPDGLSQGKYKPSALQTK